MEYKSSKQESRIVCYYIVTFSCTFLLHRLYGRVGWIFSLLFFNFFVVLLFSLLFFYFLCYSSIFFQFYSIFLNCRYFLPPVLSVEVTKSSLKKKKKGKNVIVHFHLEQKNLWIIWPQIYPCIGAFIITAWPSNIDTDRHVDDLWKNVELPEILLSLRLSKKKA